MPWWNHIKLLEGVTHIDMPGEAAAEAVPEVLLNAPANNEDELAEAGSLRVEDSVIQDGLAARADRLHLFQSAVTGADAGGQHDQCRG